MVEKLSFSVTRNQENSNISNLHSVTEKELANINRYADNLQEAAQYYRKNLVDRPIHFIYADQDKSLSNVKANNPSLYDAEVKTSLYDMEVMFNKDDFINLSDLYLDRKDTAQTLEDLADGNGKQNDILISQENDVVEKLSTIDRLPDLVNANKVVINNNFDIEQDQKLNFVDIIQAQDSNNLLPNLKDFDPKILRPRLLINAAVKNEYGNVPNRTILAVVRENDLNNARDLDFLSVNQAYLKDSGEINNLKDLVFNGIERKKAVESGRNNKVTNMAKQLRLKKISKLSFSENDSLYQRTQKLAKFIYKNGEWTEDDIREAAIEKSREIVINDRPIVEVEKIALSDSRIPDYFETEKLKAAGNAAVYRIGWETLRGSIFHQNVFIDTDNKSTARHAKRFAAPRAMRNPFNGELLKERKRIKKNYVHDNEGVVFNEDRLIGSSQFKKALLDEFNKQQSKLDFTKTNFEYYLNILFDSKMSGKKHEHYFKKGGYGYSFYEKEAKFISDYIDSVYDVSVQHEYENKLDKQFRANAFVTKANINKDTKEAMDNTSLNKYFRYVELDNDVDLNELHKFEGEMSKLQEVLPKVPDRQLILRLRKLGNYQALGMYSPIMNTIALDFRSSDKKVNEGYVPIGTGIQSFVHEYGHFLDYNYNSNQDGTNLLNSLSLQDDFKPIIDKYKIQLKKNGIYDVRHGEFEHYFATPTEVFARAFEIYSSDQGLESSLIHNRSKYFTDPEYLSYTPEIKDMITEYFDRIIPDYAQRIRTLAQKSVEDVEIKVSPEVKINNTPVENAEQQSLDLISDIPAETNNPEQNIDDKTQDTKIEVDKKLDNELDKSAEDLVNTLKTDLDTKINSRNVQETKDNPDQNNQEFKVDTENTEKVTTDLDKNNTKENPLRKDAAQNNDKNQEKRNNKLEESYRLRRARQKLERLEKEYSEAAQNVFDHYKQTNGQPMNDKRGGDAFFKKANKLEERVTNLSNEIEKQKDRIQQLEWQEENKALGLNKQGGLIMSVENIPRIKEEIEKAKNGESRYNAATIRKYKKELVKLEQIATLTSKLEEKLTPGAKNLIDSESLNQWKKKPNIYFVSGLRKVALEINEQGLLEVSAKYAPKTENEEQVISELLQKQSEINNDLAKSQEEINRLEEERNKVKEDEETKENQETKTTDETIQNDEVEPKEETKEVNDSEESEENTDSEEDNQLENEKKKEVKEEKEVAEVIESIEVAEEVEKAADDLVDDLEDSGIITGLVDDVEANEVESSEETAKNEAEEANVNEVQENKANTSVTTESKQNLNNNESGNNKPDNKESTQITNQQLTPIRKVTTEMINKAKNQDVLAVAQNLGIELIRGRNGSYHWEEEPTFEINPKMKLFTWKDKDIYNANAIELVKAKNNLNYKEAVQYLNETEIPKFDFEKVKLELNNGEVKSVKPVEKQQEPQEKTSSKSVETKNETPALSNPNVKGVGKVPKRVTAKQIKAARERNILEVAQNLGMDLIKEGQTYRWKEHDSLVIFPQNNTYSWFSLNKMGQNPIDLAQEIGGMDFKTSVTYLNSSNLEEFDSSKLAADEPQKPFVNMLRSTRNDDRLRGYLSSQRNLSQETINDFIKQGVIYQANYKNDGVYEPVIVFKHNEMDGKNVGASVQGTRLDNSKYGKHGYIKKIIANSKRNYGISFNSGDLKSNDKTQKIVFFEAPIDMMSYYELNKDNLGNTRLIAMNGLKDKTISNHFIESSGFSNKATLDNINQRLTDNGWTPEESRQRFIDNGWSIKLAVDNDDKGRQFIEKMRAKYPMIPFEAELPPLLKGREKTDWNDYLKASKANTVELAEKQPEIVKVQATTPVETQNKVVESKDKTNQDLESVEKKPIESKTTQENLNTQNQVEKEPTNNVESSRRIETKVQNENQTQGEFEYENAKANELSNHALKIIKNITKDPQELEKFMDMLGQFPEYSPRNVALAYEQAKLQGIEIKKLGDYNKWLQNHDTYKLTKDDIIYSEETAQKMKDSGREYEQKLSVRTGEKGMITLFRPATEKIIPRTDKEGNILKNAEGKVLYKKYQPSKLTDTEKELLATDKIQVISRAAKDKAGRAKYKSYKVFDISQTTLKPESYNKIVDKHHYDYNNNKHKLYQISYSLKNYAKERGIKYGRDKENVYNLHPNTRGKYFDHNGVPTVVMNNNVTKNSGFAENLAVGIRLLSHATLHTTKIDADERPRTVQGIEAEIMGHAVASHFGLKTEKRWLKEMSEELQKLDDLTLAKSFGRAQNNSREFIKGIAKYADKPQRNRNHGRKPQQGIAQKVKSNIAKTKRNFGFNRAMNPSPSM